MALAQPPRQTAKPLSYEEWLAQRNAVGNPSGQPLTYDQWLQQRGGGQQQQAAPTGDGKKSPQDTVMDAIKTRGEKYLQEQASAAVSGNAPLTEATQAAWNAPGLAASGGTTLGAAGATTAASAAMIPTVAGGVATIPAGAAIPAGWVGVGSAAGGGTMVAPAAGAAAGGGSAAGGSSLGAAAGAAWPVAAAVTALMSGMNYASAKKNAKGSGLTKDEVRTVYDPWKPVADKIPGVRQFNNLYFGKIAPERFIFGKLLGSSKHEDQIYRDRFRKTVRDMDLTNTNHEIEFSDGSKFNIGQDGGFRDENGLRAFDAGADALEPGNWKGRIIANLNPLGTFLSGGRAKTAEDATGYFTKAAITGAKDEAQAMQRVKEIYAKTGLTLEDAMNSISELEKMAPDKGGLDKQKADIYRNSVQQVLAGGPAPAQAAQRPGTVNASNTTGVPRIPSTNSPVATLNKLPPGAQPTFTGLGTNGQPMTGQELDPGRLPNGPALIPKAPAVMPVPAAPTAPAPIMIPKRSKTSSPGIGLDGRPI